MDFNEIKLTGVLQHDFVVDHETDNEKFYRNEIAIETGRGAEPYILPIFVSHYAFIALRGKQAGEGDLITAEGQIRVARYLDDAGVRHRDVYILVEELTKHEEGEEFTFANEVHISGSIVRAANYRTAGYRERSSFSIGVERAIGAPNYIMVLSSGRVARATKSLIIDDKIDIHGRFRVARREVENEEGVTMTRFYSYVIADSIDVVSYADEKDETPAETQEGEAAEIISEEAPAEMEGAPISSEDLMLDLSEEEEAAPEEE